MTAVGGTSVPNAPYVRLCFGFKDRKNGGKETTSSVNFTSSQPSKRLLIFIFHLIMTPIKIERVFYHLKEVKVYESARLSKFNLLSGVLERPEGNVFSESKTNSRRWCMKCQPTLTAGSGFFQGKSHTQRVLNYKPRLWRFMLLDASLVINPIILTKTLQLNHLRKLLRKNALESIHEYATAETKRVVPSELTLEVNIQKARMVKSHGWFNAGVRVGVGIGLGICLGIGIGVGLMLVRT
ncbi:hypothetical protein H6P81_018540 [Aristolochia fimbriata]|uniref:Uncharacterized protein n=1 Tax=Aristolochia fimbriata TaxID=158543 RepID=A0AAV7E2W5_ARIFI|nr:hypothetical protein H6P81_018540 [Aristolochia fimbriata]